MFKKFKPITTISNRGSKPIAYSSKSFPFNSIDDRRFEEFIFSVYKQKIESDAKFQHQFDDIFLMQGVGEKGRDCILYKKNISVGLLQCKKYSTRISKPDAIKEILKFILYSLVDNTLIPDIKLFTYHFIASSGFSEPASDCLTDFPNEVIKEVNLKDWCLEIQKKYSASLSCINVENEYPAILKKISQINVIKVIPQELDIELQKDYNQNLIPLFFEVRTVIDNSILEQKLNELKEQIIQNDSVTLSTEEIEQKFKTASIQLSNHKSLINNLPDTHIDRTETKEIINWLETPLQNRHKPILLLAGNPGFGKSVIMKDVYSSLQQNNIPTIAIKSDRYYVSSLNELTVRMNLEYSVIDLVKELGKSKALIVVLIDQIDALSQSVTSKRDYIDTYNQLIIELSLVPNVRIIISIRTFDLNYDFEFASLREVKTITVNRLSKASLEIILNKFSININNLSEQFIELISIPNNLDVFCKVYNENINISIIYSIQDLYNELWKQKLLTQSKADTDKMMKCLYLLAKEINEATSLSISSTQYEERYLNEINYLNREGFILFEKKTIQFFHQTFYDYVFAKYFVESGKPLLKYIFQHHQSILIRPTIKMIVAFYRSQNSLQYQKSINDILFGNKIRFHIQLLILNEIGFENNPNPFEIDLVKNKLLSSNKYFIPFIEAVIGLKWFQIFNHKNIFDKLLFPKKQLKEIFLETVLKVQFVNKIGFYNFNKNNYQSRVENYRNLWYSIIYTQLQRNALPALEYLKITKHLPDKNITIIRFLSSLKKWEHKIAFELFEQHFETLSPPWFYVLEILEASANYNFEWSINQFKKIFNTQHSNLPNRHTHDEYQVKKYFETLKTINNDKFFNFGLIFIKEIVQKSITLIQVDTTKIYQDGKFDLFDFNKENHYDLEDEIYQLVLDSTSELANQQSNLFNDFFTSCFSDNSASVLKICLYALDNSAPKFPNETFTFLKALATKNGLIENYKYFIRNLLTKYYSTWSIEQQEIINQIILSLKDKQEIGISNWNGKRQRYCYVGLKQFEYLSSIPKEDLIKYRYLKLKFLELERRYGKSINKHSHSVSMHRVGTPIVEDAYEKMKLEDWENSFLKFDDKFQQDFFSHKGGLLENYRMFEEKISLKPIFFLPLIKKIINENKVSKEYIIAALSGLTKAEYDPIDFVILFKKVIQLNVEKFNVLQLVWMTNYINKNNLIDEQIFDFLSSVATEDENPKVVLNPANPKFDTLNTNRGAAVHEIVRCYGYKNFSDRIFDTLFKVANDPIISVKMSALYDMAVLMNLDKEKTFQLFQVFMNNVDDEDVFESSINTVQYLANYNFTGLKSYFIKAITLPKVQEHIAVILVIAWLNDREGSYELLETLWENNEKTKAKVIDVAINNYLAGDASNKRKCFELYCKFLNQNSKEIIHEYSTAFLHLNPNLFEEYIEILKAFANSNAAINDPHYFYDYLIKCSKKHPVECLDFIKNYKKYKEPNHFEGPYYEGNEPIKIIVSSFNALLEIQPLNKKYITYAIELFDEMLLHPLFRKSAHTVLNTL